MIAFRRRAVATAARVLAPSAVDAQSAAVLVAHQPEGQRAGTTCRTRSPTSRFVPSRRCSRANGSAAPLGGSNRSSTSTVSGTTTSSRQRSHGPSTSTSIVPSISSPRSTRRSSRRTCAGSGNVNVENGGTSTRSSSDIGRPADRTGPISTSTENPYHRTRSPARRTPCQPIYCRRPWGPCQRDVARRDGPRAMDKHRSPSPSAPQIAAAATRHHLDPRLARGRRRPRDGRPGPRLRPQHRRRRRPRPRRLPDRRPLARLRPRPRRHGPGPKRRLRRRHARGQPPPLRRKRPPALSAYNAGSPDGDRNPTDWGDGKPLGYADSVLRHYARLRRRRSDQTPGAPATGLGAGRPRRGEVDDLLARWPACWAESLPPAQSGLGQLNLPQYRPLPPARHPRPRPRPGDRSRAGRRRTDSKGRTQRWASTRQRDRRRAQGSR